MSFDIFVQKFENGGAGLADAEVIRALLAPYLRGNDTRRLYTTDGTTELFGWDSLSRGFMVNHAGGREIWDVLVRVAKAAGLTIMPIGCPVAVTSPDDISHLPPDLLGNVLVVASGQDLLDSIRDA